MQADSVAFVGFKAGLLGLGLETSGLKLNQTKCRIRFRRAAKIIKESSINIGICETFLFSLHHEYLM